MLPRYYGPLLGLAASLSLLLGGCGSGSSRPAADAFSGVASPQAVQQAKSDPTDDTDATLWTVLGLARRPSQLPQGPHTGANVSPVLWQAALETLHFAGTSAEDSDSGLLVTKWYSPPDKPNERLQVAVFVLSRALRSDSVAVTVKREVRSADSGAWQPTPVAKDVVDGLESAILLRAQQIHAERYREIMYK